MCKFGIRRWWIAYLVVTDNAMLFAHLEGTNKKQRALFTKTGTILTGEVVVDGAVDKGFS
jgi:hypothetical protein